MQGFQKDKHGHWVKKFTLNKPKKPLKAGWYSLTVGIYQFPHLRLTSDQANDIRDTGKYQGKQATNLTFIKPFTNKKK